MGRKPHRLAESVVVVIVAVGMVVAVVLLTGSSFAQAKDTTLSANTRVLVIDLQLILTEDSGSLGTGGAPVCDALAPRLRAGAEESPQAVVTNPFSGSSAIVTGDLSDVASEKAPAVFISADPAVGAIGDAGAGRQAGALGGSIIVSVDQTGRVLDVFSIDRDGAPSGEVVRLSF